MCIVKWSNKNMIPEYFFISQKVNQGLAVPTHYQILKDDVVEGLNKAEFFKKIQEVSFKLCYLYYNVSGAIRIPAPLKYAISFTKMLILTSSKGITPTPSNFYDNNFAYNSCFA